MRKEDEVRKSLRKDITGPYELPGLDKFHVKHTKKEPTPLELWEAYLKACKDNRVPVVLNIPN
jgi:hypothetical protein